MLHPGGRTRLMFTCVLGRYVTSTVLLVPKLSEGAHNVGGQLRRNKEYPFSVKVPESQSWSVWPFRPNCLRVRKPYFKAKGKALKRVSRFGLAVRR